MKEFVILNERMEDEHDATTVIACVCSKITNSAIRETLLFLREHGTIYYNHNDQLCCLLSDEDAVRLTLMVDAHWEWEWRNVP